jgi:hypothetical protein
MVKKRKTKKAGVVQKIVKSPVEPEKAQIEIQGGDHLYKELRIENKLETDSGVHVKLKVGAPVEVTIEAEEKDTLPLTDEKKTRETP